MVKYEDLSNTIYKNFSVIEPYYKQYQGKQKLYWKCKCNCGSIFYATKTNIKSGKIKSCGCFQKEYQRKKHLGTGKISINDTFGLLKVIDTKIASDRKTHYICKCDCGNVLDLTSVSLTKKGGTKSCGCICKKHGMFGSRIYGVWRGMKERCYVPTCISYPNYGARGIKVCDEWQEFIPFMEWSYANGYDENAPRGQCTLDRIDVNGNYCPENCRWVDISVQQNNTRTNVYLEYNGVVDTLSNHARNVDISPVLAESRYLRGLPLSDVFKVGRVGEVKKVAQYDKEMNLIKIWDSCMEICETLGYKMNSLRGNLAGYTKTHKGYIWKYYDEEG